MTFKDGDRTYVYNFAHVRSAVHIKNGGIDGPDESLTLYFIDGTKLVIDQHLIKSVWTEYQTWIKVHDSI